MKVKMNKNAWSKESKQSYIYDSATDYYEDEVYKCYRCGKSAVFTALEKKETYEIHKCYIWQKRTLCPDCYVKYKKLKKQLSEYQEQWNNGNENSKHTAPYLNEWLSGLNEICLYGKPKNESVINHIRKLIDDNA